MKVLEAYNKYQTPKNLQEHMLRVAAVAKIILENWQENLNIKNEIIIACLLHDIAKPVAFNLSIENLTKYGMGKKEFANLENLQNFIKTNFGPDEHQAAIKMCKALNVKPEAVKIVEKMKWDFIPRLIKANNIANLIAIYSDMRIGPNGILSIKDRTRDLLKRYGVQRYQNDTANGLLSQKIIQEKTKTDLQQISDDDLENNFSYLLNLEI